MAKEFNKKIYDQLETKILKLKEKKKQMEKLNPDALKKPERKSTPQERLDALNTIIGYLIRKTDVTNIPIGILIEIADEIDKELSQV